MSSLIIDYIVNGDNHVYSQFFVFKSIDSYRNPCYKLIEIFSYNHVPVRKKLSLKTIKELMDKRDKPSDFWIDVYSFYFSDLEKVRKKLGVYMPDDTLNCVCNWIKKEIG